MNDMNVASFVKRPDEYKALKFDTAESYETMCRWLHDEMAMQRVHWTERFGFIDGPYIEFVSFDKPYKVFPGMWVVISEKDGSTEVLHDVAFKQKYMAAEAQYRGTESEYEEAEVASDTTGYDKHDEIVAVNENPEIITNVPVFDEPRKDPNDVGSFISGIWYPRYFQTLGSNSKFFIGEKNGSISMIAKSDIPQGHMAYPISWENATRLSMKA